MPPGNLDRWRTPAYNTGYLGRPPGLFTNGSSIC